MAPRGLDPRAAGCPCCLPSRTALKGFVKPAGAQEHHAEREMFGPHPDRLIAVAEAEFYRVGNDFLRRLVAGCLGKPLPAARALEKSFHAPVTGQVPGWGDLARLFSPATPPTEALGGWEALVQSLTSTLLPAATVEAAAARMALQTHLMWKVGQRLAEAPLVPSWVDAQAGLFPAQSASLHWAKAHGMVHLQGLAAEAQQTLREVFLASKEAGEGTRGLETRMLEKAGTLNRDWRRIAVTETGMAAASGQLASVPPGVPHIARIIPSPMACPHCLALAGRTFEVLLASDPAKGQTALWPGKNNVGRSAHRWSRKEGRYRESHEMWWPCCPMHPWCACGLLISPAPKAKPKTPKKVSP